MDRIMLHRAVRGALSAAVIAALTACGGGGGSQTLNTQPQGSMGSMALSVSDASSEDWATIGVRVLSIALVPQGGGAALTVWTAPTPAPYVNLEQLDQLGEILGNVSVPTGTYSGAVLTVARQSRRPTADGLGQPRERLSGRRRHQHSGGPDPDPGQAGQRRQLHRAGAGLLRLAR